MQTLQCTRAQHSACAAANHNALLQTCPHTANHTTHTVTNSLGIGAGGPLRCLQTSTVSTVQHGGGENPEPCMPSLQNPAATPHYEQAWVESEAFNESSGSSSATAEGPRMSNMHVLVATTYTVQHTHGVYNLQLYDVCTTCRALSASLLQSEMPEVQQKNTSGGHAKQSWQEEAWNQTTHNSRSSPWAQGVHSVHFVKADNAAADSQRDRSSWRRRVRTT